MVRATYLSSTEMLSGIQFDVPFPIIFGAIKRAGIRKGLGSALAPVSESRSLVEYTRVSFPFSLVEANTNNLGEEASESWVEATHHNVEGNLFDKDTITLWYE